MEKAKEYERVKLELVYFESSDIITTSNGTLGGENGDGTSWDNNGWT